MNKTLMPALLVATILVAGAFAFVPVEQATTVHLSGTVVSDGLDNDTGDVLIDASTDAVSISAGTEAVDSNPGEISIDASTDIKIDAVSGIHIRAGGEAAAQADGVLALTSTAGTVITAGGLTVTAGGLTVTAGGLDMTNDAITNIGNAGTDFSAAGALTTAAGITATTGGVTATAGGLTATAGGLTVVAGVTDIQGNTNIGNANTDTLTVASTVAFTSIAIQDMDDNSAEQTIAADAFYKVITILANGAADTLGPTAIADGFADGQVMIIQMDDAAVAALTIVNGENFRGNGGANVVLDARDSIIVVWDASASDWIQIAETGDN